MPTTSTFIRSIVGIFSTPIEETLDALDTLVRAGKVRYLGASSMAAWQFSKALYLAKQNGWHRFVAMQNHYNLIYREEETRDGSGLRGSGRRTDSLEPASAWISPGGDRKRERRARAGPTRPHRPDAERKGFLLRRF